MRLVLTITLLVSVAAIANAQDEPRSGIFDPFDRWFGPISAEHERWRLDNFAIALQKHPDWIGYILVTGNSTGPRAAQRRANRMKNYVVCYREVEWQHVTAVAAGSEAESKVVLQPLSKASLEKPFFEYFRRLPKPVATNCKHKNFSRRLRRRTIGA